MDIFAHGFIFNFVDTFVFAIGDVMTLMYSENMYSIYVLNLGEIMYIDKLVSVLIYVLYIYVCV